VTFKPTATGARSAAVTITDNAAGSPHSFTLSGTGTTVAAPTVSLSGSSLTFASQTLNTTSGSQSVTLTNTGNAALGITGIAVTGANSGDFAQTNTCGSSVAANNGSCTISVTFKPTATGARSAAVTITDNAAGSPHAVTLTGTGTTAATPGASVSPASLTFASQAVTSTSAAQTVTLSNSGGAALTITGIAASGDFSQTNNCGSSLAAGGNCSISVKFTPTAAGTRTGTVSVTDNASGSPQVVSLTGTGSTGTPDFSFSLSTASQTVTAGLSVTFNLTITPSGGFNSAINLACNGAPQGAACGISPSTVTPNGTSASTTKITVSTTSRVMVVPGPREILPTPGALMGLTKLAWVMVALAMLATMLVNKRRRASLAVGFTILLVVMGTGCVGVTKVTALGPGTPSGTYTLTLTGTSGTGSSVVAHSMDLIVVVK